MLLPRSARQAAPRRHRQVRKGILGWFLAASLLAIPAAARAEGFFDFVKFAMDPEAVSSTFAWIKAEKGAAKWADQINSRLTSLAIYGSSELVSDQANDADEMFGSVSIPASHLAIERRWSEISPVHAATLFAVTCHDEEAVCGSPLMHAWFRVGLNPLRVGAPALERIRQVNAEVNAALRYRSDMENYGVPDFWASPRQAARRGSADCKAFALTKMWMLTALGFPASSLRLVVVKDNRNGLGHAILVVSLDGRNYLLDNMTGEVRRDVEISRYQPLYAVNAAGSWIYGRRRTQPAPGETARAPLSAAPADSALALRGSLDEFAARQD